VAGGTGLAPVLSMIDGIRQWGGRKPQMLLSFGCATPDALFCLDELELRRQWLPTLEARISVDRGAEGDLLSGSPVAALREGDVAGPDTVAYLCGPQPMIDAATQRLIELGVSLRNTSTASSSSPATERRTPDEHPQHPGLQRRTAGLVRQGLPGSTRSACRNCCSPSSTSTARPAPPGPPASSWPGIWPRWA
jgi:ferredoxin-NADP reductase